MTSLHVLLDRVKSLRDPDRDVDLAIWNEFDTDEKGLGPWVWERQDEAIIQSAFAGPGSKLRAWEGGGSGICALEKMTESVEDAMGMAKYGGLEPLDLLSRAVRRVNTLPKHLYDEWDLPFLLCRDMMTIILERRLAS